MATTVVAVDRAFALLRAVPRTGGTLSELSRETGLPVATVSRLMGTLEQVGAVSRRAKVYRIGPAVMELVGGERPSFDLLALADGHLNAMVTDTGETAGIARSEGAAHVHLGQVATTHDVSVRDWTGVRVAAHSGCIGFVLMAHWDDGEVDDYLAGDLERFSPVTLTTVEQIKPLLVTARRQGYLWTVDQFAVGVTTVAAPVLDRDGRPVASLYVHGPSYRWPADQARDAIGVDIAQRARAISAVLGHHVNRGRDSGQNRDADD